MGAVDFKCSVVHTLEVLGKKWNVFIFAELLAKPYLTFTDLKRKLSGNYSTEISSRVLKDKLNELEKNDLVARIRLDNERVGYALTDRGIALKDVLEAMKTWAINYGNTSFENCKNKSCIHNCLDFVDLEIKKD